MTIPAFHDLARVALDAAEAASAVHLRRIGRVRAGDAVEKGIRDFVSAVDVEAEEAAVAVIRAYRPEDPILAEEAADARGCVPRGEFSEGRPEADVGAAETGEVVPHWIVDPLDGTTNFLHGHPAFAASVGVVVEGKPVAGAVVQSMTGDRYTGWAGGGAWLHRGGASEPERIRTSEIGALDRALVGTGFPFKRPRELPDYLPELGRVLRASSGVRRDGAAALDLCFLACGIFDAFWEGRLEPWDVAGGLAILAEAGGVWSAPGGAEYDIVSGGPLRAANGEALLVALHEVLV